MHQTDCKICFIYTMIKFDIDLYLHNENVPIVYNA